MALGDTRLRIIVAGLVGQYPLGGMAWDYFQYCIGLHLLGHDVVYFEDTWAWPFDPVKRELTDQPDHSVATLADFFRDHLPPLADRWFYRHLHAQSFGMAADAFDAFARSADVFLNVSGACFFPDALNPKCRKIFLDTDPGYNQIVYATRPAWSPNVVRWCEHVDEHDAFATFAENIGSADCRVPTIAKRWQATRSPVVLAAWETVRDSSPPPGAPFTTVMSWQHYRSDLVFEGRVYNAKPPEFAKFFDLPVRTPAKLQVAASGSTTPVSQLEAAGWTLVDPGVASGSASSYAQFIAASAGEWSIAKNVYVATRSGWFSSRTACYLAAGRPAVVQDTGWSRYLPSGSGLFAFATIDEAADGLARVLADPRKHQLAAYDVAREYLAHDRVLPKLLDATC